MTKKFVSLFLALAMCLSLSAPAWAENASTQTSTSEKTCYLQQCDEGYRLVDSARAYSARNSDSIIAVELTDGGTIYQSADQRYFYQAIDDLFLEVGCVEIPATCENSVEEIKTEYNLPDCVAERVYDILHSRNLTTPVKVYSSGLMAGRAATTYKGYGGHTYQDYIGTYGIDTPYVEMFNSEDESEESMKSKRISIEVGYAISGVLNFVTHGVFTLVELGVDLSNSGVIHTSRTWSHSVGMRGEQTEKLTTVLLGNEYMYGARTTKAEWDFVEILDGGRGTNPVTTYSQTFSAETPNYSDPSELCFKNYFYGGVAEWLENVSHGHVTFSLG